MHSARLAGIGAAIGTVASIAALTALSAAIRLRNGSFLDVSAFAAGVALVMAAALLAAYAPARRASRVDPSQTLHIDA
jgi:ABC-type antimicrobial peptide transport system permease subunit